MERKAQKALDAANDYFEANRMEITLYQAAEKYLKNVLQERFDSKKLPSTSIWEKELAGVFADVDRLNRDYGAIKDETTKAEKIQRTVRDIQRDARQERTPQKSRGCER